MNNAWSRTIPYTVNQVSDSVNALKQLQHTCFNLLQIVPDMIGCHLFVTWQSYLVLILKFTKMFFNSECLDHQSVIVQMYI